MYIPNLFFLATLCVFFSLIDLSKTAPTVAGAAKICKTDHSPKNCFNVGSFACQPDSPNVVSLTLTHPSLHSDPSIILLIRNTQLKCNCSHHFFVYAVCGKGSTCSMRGPQPWCERCMFVLCPLQ